MKISLLLIVTLFFQGASFGADLKIPSTTSTYTSTSNTTSLKDKDCLKSQPMIEFTSQEYASECPAIKDWRLFKVYDSEGRSWVEIARKGDIWSLLGSLYEPKYDFGYFPFIDQVSGAEWIISKSETPHALIFRVTAQDHKDNNYLSRFFVIGLANNIPRLCGMVNTIQEARTTAYKVDVCDGILEKRILPTGFGERTKRAVVDFQREHGLVANGIVDIKTALYLSLH